MNIKFHTNLDKAEMFVYYQTEYHNCDSVGYIDNNNLLLTEDEWETCNLGHSHMVKEATYRVPDKEETEKLRMHRDWRDGEMTK